MVVVKRAVTRDRVRGSKQKRVVSAGTHARGLLHLAPSPGCRQTSVSHDLHPLLYRALEIDPG